MKAILILLQALSSDLIDATYTGSFLNVLGWPVWHDIFSNQYYMHITASEIN